MRRSGVRSSSAPPIKFLRAFRNIKKRPEIQWIRRYLRPRTFVMAKSLRTGRSARSWLQSALLATSAIRGLGPNVVHSGYNSILYAARECGVRDSHLSKLAYIPLVLGQAK